MPNIYCPSCGSGTKFLFEKPSKCPSCGAKYVQELKKETFLVAPKKPIVSQFDTSEISLSEIKVSVEKPFTPKLGNIIGTDSSGETFSRPKIDKTQYFRSVFESKENTFE